MPKASSPTRSLLSSVWQYDQKSRSRSPRSRSCRHESTAADFEHEGRSFEAAVLRVEVVAGRAVADERPVYGRRCGEHLARRQVRPVAGIDEAARLDPRERPIECRGEVGAGRGTHGQPACGRHALAELLAQTIHTAVVRAHAFAHDAWRHAHHVRVADAPALHEANDRHPRAQLAFLGLHAQDPRVSRVERGEHRRRRAGHRAGGDGLDVQTSRGRAAIGERLLEARGHIAARFVGDERDPFASLDRKADVDRVARTWKKIRRRRTKGHSLGDTQA